MCGAGNPQNGSPRQGGASMSFRKIFNKVGFAKWCPSRLRDSLPTSGQQFPGSKTEGNRSVMRTGVLSRCAAGYLSVFLLLGASNVYAVLKLHVLDRTTIPALNADIRILECQKTLINEMLSEMRYERKYLLTRDPRLYDQFLEANREFHRYLAEGHAAAKTRQRDLFGAVETHHIRYETLVSEELTHLADNRSYGRGQYRTEKDNASDAVLEALKTLGGYGRKDADLRVAMVNRARTSSLGMTVWSLMFTLLFSLVVSYIVTRSITGPLAKLVSKTREIAAGVFRGNLDIASPSEVSELAGAFNAMCERLAEVDGMKNDFLSLVSHRAPHPPYDSQRGDEPSARGGLRRDHGKAGTASPHPL